MTQTQQTEIQETTEIIPVSAKWRYAIFDKQYAIQYYWSEKGWDHGYSRNLMPCDEFVRKALYVDVWYASGGDLPWGYVTFDNIRYKRHKVTQLLENYRKGVLKDHHRQWIEKCYYLYYELPKTWDERRLERIKRRYLVRLDKMSA